MATGSLSKKRGRKKKDKKAIREEKRKIDENIIKLYTNMPTKTKSAMD